MPKLTKFKEQSKFLIFLIIFLLTLLLFYKIIPFLYYGGIRIFIYISELKKIGSFWMSTRNTCEIILMGPVFAIIYYFLMKQLIIEIDKEQGKNKYYVVLIEIGVLVFICISVMGHAIHVLFNNVSRVYYDFNGGMDTSELYSLLYYSDEWLGHHLIHVGYFGYIIMALFVEFLAKENRKLNKDELLYAILCGIGLSIIFTYIACEGQAAVMVLTLCCVLLIIELIIIIMKNISILERPILMCTLINNIIVIGFFILWVIIFGIKPYYPFIYQPSELG